jgi:hypothetical protein
MMTTDARYGSLDSRYLSIGGHSMSFAAEYPVPEHPPDDDPVLLLDEDVEGVAPMPATSQVFWPHAATSAALFALAVAGLARLRGLCRRRRRRPPLRDCPLCGSEAVATFEYDLIDGLRARVLQQCGACGVWRQTVTSLYVAARHERTLEADRTAIRRSAERLDSCRAVSETNAFVAALYADVVGADDLLALIRSDASAL